MSSSSSARRLSGRCFLNLAATTSGAAGASGGSAGGGGRGSSGVSSPSSPSSGVSFLHLERKTNQPNAAVRRELEKHLEETVRVVRSAGTAASKKEASVYVGSPGIAFAFLKLAWALASKAEKDETKDEERDEEVAGGVVVGRVEDKKKRIKMLIESAQSLLSDDLLQSSLLQTRRHASLGPSLLCGPAGFYIVLAVQAWVKMQEERGFLPDSENGREGSSRDSPGGKAKAVPSEGGNPDVSSSSTSSSSSPSPDSTSTSASRRKSSSSSSASQTAFLKAVKGYESFYSYALDKLDSDEWLYGRVGYLYGLLFLNYLSAGSISNSLLNDLALAVLESGIECGRKVGVSPLMYAWHDKYYLGAAHGVFGILYVLMLVPSVRRDLNAMRYVKGTLDWLLTLETENHNYPACLGESQDHLCHFCHGATGAVFTFSVASVIFNHREFQKAALRAGECVWRYGLLKKGCGICHGISGSGYALLACYKLTRDPVWLDRATEFALKMFDEKLQADSRVPDNPFSLFEGLSGAICFLVDLLYNPLKSSFPFFELGF